MIHHIRKDLKCVINPQLIVVCGITWQKIGPAMDPNTESGDYRIDGVPVVVLSCFGSGYKILSEAIST